MMLSLRSYLLRTLRCTSHLRALPSQGVVRWRLLSSGSGAAAEPVATQWSSPTVDDIHLAASYPVATGMNTGKPFSEFSLDDEVVKRLKKLGFATAFEIQDKTLPLTLEGRDVIGRAITGSGKTLAFALPIIHKLSKSRRRKNPRALVITPTRELCQQVTRSIQSLSEQLRCVSLYGGVPYGPQETALHRGVDVVCATPGRLNDHFQRENFKIDNVQFLILDEADELLTPNFKEQINRFLEECPESKQMMLFSATMPKDIKDVVRRYMNDPVMVDLTSDRSLVPDNVVHHAIEVPHSKQLEVVADLLLMHKPRRAIVFTPTKSHTQRLSFQLNSLGLSAQAINSNFSQRQRENCLRDFRSGHANILVATDVAARGIDVPETDVVIQVEPPPNGLEYYIHRTGRTGRKGQPGLAILVYSGGENVNGLDADELLRQIKRSKIPIKHVSPPSGLKVMEAVLDDTVTRVKNVDPSYLEVTRPLAEKLMDSDEGVDSLAGALALLSNVDIRLRAQSSGRDRYQSDYGRDDGSWRRQRYRDFDDRITRRKFHFDEPSNPFFPKRRKSFAEVPPDADNRRERDWGPRRSSFPKFSPDGDERGMGRWGKERGQGSFRRNKQMEHRFLEDYMEEDFDDDDK